MRLSILFFLISSVIYGQTLTDARDQQTYAYKKLGKLYWMTENLRFDAQGSICLKDCDQIRFYDFNYLANICPEGWRLPSMLEWDAFTESFEGVESVRMMEGNKKLYRVDFLDQFNLFDSNALNIKPYGRIEGGEFKKGKYIDYWTVNDETDARFHMHISPYSITGHTHKHHLKSKKPEQFRLFAVRCVCEITDKP